MRRSKLLALLLAITMIFTMGSTINLVSAEGEIITVNVAPGESYTLPETVNEVMVTSWSPATVDTSKVGYKLYTGTFEDGTTVTYRINVGEYVQKYDLLAPFSVGDVAAKIAANGESYTGSYHDIKKGDAWLRVYNKNIDTIEIEQYDSDTKALRLGPDSTSSASFIAPQTQYKDEYRLNARVKLSGITLSEDNQLVGRWDITETSGPTPLSRVHVYVTKDGIVRFASEGGVASHNANKDTSVRLQADGSTPWFDVSYRIYDSTWSVAVNGEDILVDKSFFAEGKSVGLFKFSPQDYTAGDTTLIYFTDITLDSVRYFEGELPESVTDTIAQGDAAEQKTTVALNMSDGNTKDFTVNYTADTSSAGSKTANGTIDGFDGIIPVNYKVTGIENATVNTYIGADISSIIPDADTSLFGRKYYKVPGEDIVTNYTVNTGEWGIKVSDGMNSHQSTTYTKADGETSYETIKAVNSDGFKLVVTNSDSENQSAVLAKEPGNEENTVIKFTDMVHSDNLRWYLGDTFSGSFKVKMRLRFADFTRTKDSYTLRIMLHNSENKTISQSFVRLLADSSGNATGEYGLADYYNNGSAANYVKAGNATQTDGKYDTGWIDLEIIGNAETKTIDTYLNGELMHSGYGLMSSSATVCDLARIGISRRYSNANNDSVVYVDDVEVYTHRVFTDALPEGEEVLLGQNAASLDSNIDLTLSDGSVKTLPMTLEGVDSSKLGTVRAKGVIPGFDDEVNVNVKVCNYDIVSIGYGNGSEYVSAPMDGGSIKEATFKNVGDAAGAKAIFAWYNAQNKLDDAKLVDISGIAKGETKKVDVGLNLPADLAGGYLKIFVLNVANGLMPLDLAHIEKETVAIAPTVFMTGDSTVCNYDDYRFPENGLGQKIGTFLDGIEIVNLASSGKTTTSFIENGLWDSVIKQAKAGDYIFVSFGHNDQGDVTAADYKANLIKFITDARTKGANVIMFTPIARRTEGQQGIAYERFNGSLDSEEYKGHLDDMKAVGTEYGVPVVDMTTIASTYLQSITDVESIKHYMCDIYYSWDSVYKDLRNWSDSDSFSDSAYREGQYGKQDNTHFTQYGAAKWAQMLLKNLKSSYPSINLNNYMTNLDSAISYPSGTIAQ